MKREYVRRISAVMEFISKNLDQKLTLSILAKEAAYSPFHFHRLFTAIVGEPPTQYILRKRVERAAFQIKKDPEVPMLDVALNNGFESNSSFTKAFKRHYGVAPTHLKGLRDGFSKIRQINSKNGKREIEISQDLWDISKLIEMVNSAPIHITQLPAREVAYVTHIGPFDQVGSAFGKLMAWAGVNGLLGGKTLIFYPDNPEVTDLQQIRKGASIELTRPAKPSGLVNLTTLEAGTYAVGKFEVLFQEFEQAWQSMMVWISENGYLPNEKVASYEVYHDSSLDHPKQKSSIEICVPVKPE